MKELGFNERPVLPDHRAADHRPRDAHHVAARRQEEDEQVRPLGPVAHRPDGRRRHDLEEDQARDHRPRAAADRGQGPRGQGRGREPRLDLRRAVRPVGRRRARGNSAARAGASSSRRSPISRSPCSRRRPARCAGCSPTPRPSTAFCAMAPRRRGRSRRRSWKTCGGSSASSASLRPLQSRVRQYRTGSKGLAALG